MEFNTESINQYLDNPFYRIETYDCLPSTNAMLKQRGKSEPQEGLVIAANRQTNGRGRMGRSFFSPSQSGIYFSILLRPKLKPEDCQLITTAAAVAVAQVLDRYTHEPVKIKWVNDLYHNDRKVCGILTEAVLTPKGEIDFVVLGIGINLTPPKDGFPKDIICKAGTVFDSNHQDLRGTILAEVLNSFHTIYKNLHSRTFIDEYRSRSMLDGMSIDVIKPSSTIPAKALFIDDRLRLVVQYNNGEIEHLYTGDVSIRKA